MAASESQPNEVAGLRRVGVLYVVLAIALAVVLVYVISAGKSRHAEPQIAGGYDVITRTACLGAQFELEQSGSFATISNAQRTL
jgi:hypothetical protein